MPEFKTRFILRHPCVLRRVPNFKMKRWRTGTIIHYHLSLESFALQVTKEPSYRKLPLGSFVGIVLESFGFWLELPQVRESIRDQLSLELQKLAFDKFWFVDAIQIFILICKIFQVQKLTQF